LFKFIDFKCRLAADKKRSLEFSENGLAIEIEIDAREQELDLKAPICYQQTS
jgi:hypothetical protein